MIAQGGSPGYTACGSTKPQRGELGFEQRQRISAKQGLIVFIAALICLSAHAATISVADYRNDLEKIRAALDAKDLDEAQRLAKKLNGAHVAARDGEFSADSTVLKPIENAIDLKDAAAQKPRLIALTEFRAAKRTAGALAP
jgi:hypothetical protein